MASLEDRLDNFPEAWKPTAAGEKLIGELTELNFRDSDYGDEGPYPILVVADERDGGKEKAWHGFHAMGRSEVARKKPQPGDRVGIVYGGKGEAKPGMNPPERWRLVIDRPQKQVDYSEFLASQGDLDAIVEGDPGPVTDPNDPGVDEPELSADDDIPFD